MMLIFYLIYLLLYTSSGLDIVYYIAQHTSPGKLIVEKIEGNLSSSFNLSNVSYSNYPNKFYIKKIYLKWTPLKLLTERKLYISNLILGGIKIYYYSELLPSSMGNTNYNSQIPSYLKLINIDYLSIKDVFINYDNYPIAIKNIKFNKLKNLYLLNNFNAKINNLPIHGNVSISITSQFISPLKANITFGKNLLKIDKEKLTIKIPNIKNFYSKATGEIYIIGKIYFHHFLPVINASIYSKNLAFNNQSIKSINGKLLVDGEHKSITLSNTKLTIPALGIQLTSLATELTLLDNDQIKFNGKFNSDPGVITYSGTTNATSLFPFTLNVAGNNAKLLNLEKYQLNFSPQLKIIFDAQNTKAIGQVTINSLHFTPDYLTTTVKLPPEAVIIHDDNQQDITTSDYSLNLNVTLGNDILVSSNGLAAKLSGKLSIHKSIGNAPTGTGTLYINKGEYKIYNQRLKIRNGRLLFMGNLLTDPGLNIQATKNISLQDLDIPEHYNKAYVGVDVKGTLTNPHITLISTPPMKQDEILSYLLFNSSLSGITDDNLGLLSTAITSLNIINPNTTGGTLPSQLGFLGSIGTSLLNPPKLLHFKYKLTPSLYIYTHASLEQTAIDLMYQFEHD